MERGAGGHTRDRPSNNFDLARLGLALLVVATHTRSLLHLGESAIADTLLRGDLAVFGFFVISGFLIFRSARRSDFRSYALKRIRRIYPALVAVVLVCALCGELITTASPAAYRIDALKYLVANLTFCTFLHPGLLGVFTSNEFHYVNGVLWTLKIEVGFYVVVPLLLRVRVPFSVIATTLYAGAILWVTFLSATHFTLATQLPGQLSYFMAGALIERYERVFREYYGALLFVALATTVSQWYPLQPAALAIMVLGFCIVLPPLVHASRFGDFSYGTYIWHFPILQLIATRHWPATTSAVVALALVALATWFSWHVIEEPWLRGKRPATPLQQRG